MAQRKTFDVVSLLWHVNHFLRTSKPEQTAERTANSALLELVLHQTGNYAGFGYLNMQPDGKGGYTYPDETRRMYYIARDLHFDYKRYEDKKTSEMVTVAVKSMS